VDLYEEPAAVALLAHEAHPIRVLLLVIFHRRRLHALRQEPRDRPGSRDVMAIPRPGIRGRSPGVALKKGPYVVQAAEERFLGADHHDVGIRRKELHDGFGIPCGESGAEPLEDVE
jgi:hypothetical protein